jgi:hypothetical protein
MIVSSTSTSTTSPVGSSEPSSGLGATPARPVKNREATASSWRTWPNVNDLRNEPNVDGA